MATQHELILVLDFGSQYTQLIARRVREIGVYCEIVPYNTKPEAVAGRPLRGVIFSGGPSSVYDEDAPHADAAWLELGVPVLGICYGFQHLAYFLGGKVEPSARREYGRAVLHVKGPSELLRGVPS